MPIHKLSQRKIDCLIRARDPGKYGDGGGLILQITKRGSASWLFRYSHGGKSRHMGLGGAQTFNLDEARELARKRRQEVLAGGDPIGQRPGGKAMTFERCFQGYWENRKLEINGKSRINEENRMIKYALPTLGAMRVDAIAQSDVLAVIEPHWSTKTKSMSRLRGQIEATIDWAIGRGYRTDTNPAQWRLIGRVLSSPSKIGKSKNHKALPYQELPEFMSALRAAQGEKFALRALHFMILTGVRTGDIIGSRDDKDPKPPLRWVDLDLDAGRWNIPRTKTERPHAVALSRQAIELLREIRAMQLGDDRVFPIDKNAMYDALQELRSVTVHGFRASFRTWAYATWARQAVLAGVPEPKNVIEEALAHRMQGSEVELAYQREDNLTDRRHLMQAWADFCSNAAGQVIAMPAPKVA